MDQTDDRQNGPIPTMIGNKYRVLRLLGAGGMGAVYEAENTWTRRIVAIKVLRAELAKNEDLVRRFMQEAQAGARIQHPNIVEVLDLGHDEAASLYYIVQERLTGTDLDALLAARGPMPLREAVDLVVPIMGALIAAHERGIVHRDIKPANIFVARGPSGEIVPKLIDFGVSKVTADPGASAPVTSVGTPVGTLFYMSPEQVRGDANVDGRSDVWSTAVLLYELLTGQQPFQAPNNNLLAYKILGEPPVPLEDLAPDLPAEITAVIEQALEKDLERRFGSMRAFLTALLACPPFVYDPPELSLAVIHHRSIPEPVDGQASTSPGGHGLDTPAAIAAIVAATPAARWRSRPGASLRRLARERMLAAAGALVLAAVVSLLHLRPRRAPAAVGAPAVQTAPVAPPAAATVRTGADPSPWSPPPPAPLLAPPAETACSPSDSEQPRRARVGRSRTVRRRVMPQRRGRPIIRVE